MFRQTGKATTHFWAVAFAYAHENGFYTKKRQPNGSLMSTPIPIWAGGGHKPVNMVIWLDMKTTLEIPDFLFRRAKSVAAERGIPLRQFVTEAVQEKLKTTSQERPWMKHLGTLKHLRKDRKQIEKRVEEAFEQIDPEIWQ